jgi:hypothetical protein
MSVSRDMAREALRRSSGEGGRITSTIQLIISLVTTTFYTSPVRELHTPGGQGRQDSKEEARANLVPLVDELVGYVRESLAALGDHMFKRLLLS